MTCYLKGRSKKQNKMDMLPFVWENMINNKYENYSFLQRHIGSINWQLKKMVTNKKWGNEVEGNELRLPWKSSFDS